MEGFLGYDWRPMGRWRLLGQVRRDLRLHRHSWRRSGKHCYRRHVHFDAPRYHLCPSRLQDCLWPARQPQRGQRRKPLGSWNFRCKCIHRLTWDRRLTKYSPGCGWISPTNCFGARTCHASRRELWYRHLEGQLCLTRWQSGQRRRSSIREEERSSKKYPNDKTQTKRATRDGGKGEGGALWLAFQMFHFVNP